MYLQCGTKAEGRLNLDTFSIQLKQSSYRVIKLSVNLKCNATRTKIEITESNWNKNKEKKTEIFQIWKRSKFNEQYFALTMTMIEHIQLYLWAKIKSIFRSSLWKLLRDTQSETQSKYSVAVCKINVIVLDWPYTPPFNHRLKCNDDSTRKQERVEIVAR